jgi:hypothetical protein
MHNAQIFKQTKKYHKKLIFHFFFLSCRYSQNILVCHVFYRKNYLAKSDGQSETCTRADSYWSMRWKSQLKILNKELWTPVKITKLIAVHGFTRTYQIIEVIYWRRPTHICCRLIWLQPTPPLSAITASTVCLSAYLFLSLLSLCDTGDGDTGANPSRRQQKSVVSSAVSSLFTVTYSRLMGAYLRLYLYLFYSPDISFMGQDSISH